ncbi:hypothetical protein CTAYLR_001129 [Chrysophaeum taylorii]|uniref:Protein kinase domain-containing protein n=1 Tax=Chrysophaeum taylorii TaxID=2483200 RepID=A0AAD7XQP8_9STRA|nr:hypothetical protein CTAYLR_001129 [Chrysophaeum taylorii]
MGCGASSAGKVDPMVGREEAKGDDEILGEEKSGGSAPKASSSSSSCESIKVGERIKWRKGDVIGTGANGRVYLGLEEETGAILAVKEILFSNGSQDRAELEQMQEEIEVLRTLHHPNIVAYLGTDVDDEKQTLYIFTEWVPGGSIQALVTKFGRLPEPIVRKYVAQLLVGLQYLHDKQVIHRDIKAANILVDDRGTIKLADFGSSKRLDAMGTIGNDNNSLRGTPYFMAPEVITQSGHGRKADIWSVGCTVLQMVTGQPPWKSLKLATPAALMFHVANTADPPPMPDALSPDLRAMLLCCFNRDVDKRPTAEDLLRHAFVVANGAAAEAIDAGNQLPASLPGDADARRGSWTAAPIKPADKPRRVNFETDENLRDGFSIVPPASPQTRAAADGRPENKDINNNPGTNATAIKDVPAATSARVEASSVRRPVQEESGDELLITTFISKEAAAQFAGADKHFPGRPPTARPKGAPPPRTAHSSHGRRAENPSSNNTTTTTNNNNNGSMSTTWHARPSAAAGPQQRGGSSSRGLKDEKSPLLMAERPPPRTCRGSNNHIAPGNRSSRFGPPYAGGTVNNKTPRETQEAWAARTLPHDDRPIVMTQAAKRELEAEIHQEKMRAEQSVRKNEQFQAELDRFKATMHLDASATHVVPRGV